MAEIRLIPVSDILDDALVRDRKSLAQDQFDELRLSILKHGLRHPIEIFALEGCEKPWALISGFRRLAAFRRLVDDGMRRYAEVPAFVRTPATIADALTSMVEENAIRADVSPWEQARLAVIACDHKHFDTVDAAIDTLFATLHRDRRRRLRCIAHLVVELEDVLVAPETYSQARLLRLSGAVARGFADVIRHALGELRQRDPELQWRHLLPLLAESEDPAIPAPHVTRDGRERPRRLFELPRHAVRIRRERTPQGWCLHFTGREAHGDFIDTVFNYIETTFTPE